MKPRASVEIVRVGPSAPRRKDGFTAVLLGRRPGDPPCAHLLDVARNRERFVPESRIRKPTAAELRAFDVLQEQRYGYLRYEPTTTD